MRIRCGNHDGLPIYHETAADVRFCFERGPVADFDPTDSGVKFPVVGSKAAEELARSDARAEMNADPGMETEVARYHRQQASLADGERAARSMTGQTYGGSRRVASEPMVKFVHGLATGKSMDEEVRTEALRRVEAHRRDDEPEPMAFDFAKRFIDAYKNAAKRTQIRQVEPGAYVSPNRVTQDGMYRDPATGAIYKVQWNRASGDGRRLYAKQLFVDMPNGETRTVGLLDGLKAEGASARFEYASGAIKKIDPDWRMSIEEAEKFGALYGICMRCGRDLTAEASIAAAMGPICRGKKNWS